MISVIVLTNGREDYLAETLESFKAVFADPLIEEKIIIDDSQDAEFTKRISERYGPENFLVHRAEAPLGFSGAIQRAWNLISLQSDFIFHLEDDFRLVKPIQLSDMINILNGNPALAQVSLLRQPCNKAEAEAGGIIQQWPDEFRQVSRRVKNGKKSDYQLFWVEQDLYFTTNPSLYPVKITRQGWPGVERSEAEFTKHLRGHGFSFGILGLKTDSPRVIHIGDRRTEKSFGY